MNAETPNECSQALDQAIELIQEMKEILTDGDSDAPLAFLEAAQDVQDRLNRAVLIAISPLLQSTP